MTGLNKLIIFQKIIQSISGLFLALLVIVFLNPIEQGYFYAMGSILNSYILLDMGLSSLVLQKSAKYFTNLEWYKNNKIVTKPNHKKKNKKFVSFCSWVMNWYCTLTYFCILIFPVGFIYFYFSDFGSEINWIFPWLIIVISLSYSIRTVGFFSILEGAQKIFLVYICRSIIYPFAVILSIFMMYFGYGLYAQSAVPISSIFIYLIIKKIYFKNLIKVITKNKNNFNWKVNILPQQKKVSLNTISNFLFQHAPVLIIFYCLDPETAGSFAISFIFANISLAIAFSPITSIIPKFTESLLSSKSIAMNLFFNNLYKSLFLGLFGTLLTCLILLFLQDFEISSRILDPYQVLGLFVAYGLFYFNNTLVLFFRASDTEPFAFPILYATLLIIIFCGFFLSIMGLNGFIFFMLLVYVMLTIYNVNYFLKQLNKYV
jgi:hypothetical protein